MDGRTHGWESKGKSKGNFTQILYNIHEVYTISQSGGNTDRKHRQETQNDTECPCLAPISSPVSCASWGTEIEERDRGER